MSGPEYTRQRDWYDPEAFGGEVTLIGCGGIGSFTALALAKLGVPKLTVFDPDVVEDHNLPNQMFTIEQVGTPKVVAIGEQIVAIRGDTIDLTLNQDEVGPDEAKKMSGIVASGVDSMAARAQIWHGIDGNMRVPLYLDARLGGEMIVVYAIRPIERPDQVVYAESLVSDDEAEDEPCTRRSIIDVGYQVASILTRAVRLQLTGQGVERILVHNQASMLATIGEREALV